MGVIVRRTVLEEVDLWNYVPEKYSCGCGAEIEKHTVQEGARYHVLSFHSKIGAKCSEPSCEKNHHCDKSLDSML